MVRITSKIEPLHEEKPLAFDEITSVRERISIVDTASSIRRVRAETEGVVDSFAREREIIATICETDSISGLLEDVPNRLINLRKANSGGRLCFAEYRYKTIQASRTEFRDDVIDRSYVYSDKEYQTPSFIVFDNKRHYEIPLDHPGASVLMKIEGGKVTELRRWKD